MQTNRTNTILYCRHWVDCVRFYREVLHFPVHFENEWFVEFEVSHTGYVSIADAFRTSVESSGGQGVTLSLQVNDLDGLHGHLRDKDVKPGPIQSKWGAEVFYLKDPEGHRLEFWSD